MKIGLLGPYGSGNLGDAAIQEAMIRNIRKHRPDSQIFGFSVYPDDTEKRHGVKAYPISRSTALRPKAERPATGEEIGASGRMDGVRAKLKKIPVIFHVLKLIYRVLTILPEIPRETMFLVKSYMRLRGFDLLIASGGGQLCDFWGGPWAYPFVLFKWAVLSKLTGTRFIVVSAGAGPIAASLSRFFIRMALLMATYRSYRDDESKSLVESLGFIGANVVFPDLAFSFPVIRKKGVEVRENDMTTVGVNPLSYFDPRTWPEHDKEIYQVYINKVARIADFLLEDKCRVVLFSSDRMDMKVIADVQEILKRMGHGDSEENLAVIRTDSVDDLLSCISMMDMVIASRLHTLLLSFLLHKPAIAISPHPKVDSLMRGIDVWNYRLDIRTFDPEILREKLHEMDLNRGIIVERIRNRVSEFEAALGRQYEILFGL